MADNRYDTLIAEAAQRVGIDAKLFRAQLVQESGLNPDAVSKAGAVGIGQIMPKFWTGKHGLNTPEDFRDPVKSINAAAQIMADHVKSYGGWNQALVAYNAGPGKQNKNINAYNRGDLGALPKETQDYVTKLGTSDTTGMPEAAPVAPTGAPRGVLSASAPSGLAELGHPQLTTGAASSFEPATQSAADSIGAGLRGSTFGTAWRREEPLKQFLPTTYEFSEEDKAAIRAADIGEAGVRFVMRNTFKQEEIPELIKLAQENRKGAAQSRTLVGDLAFGVGEALGDPVTYAGIAIPGGIYAKGAQLFNGQAARVAGGVALVAAEGAAQNLASESLREGYTGVDADYASAMAAGAVFSVGVLGATKALGKGADAIQRGLGRVESSQTADGLRRGGAEAVQDPTVLRPVDMDGLMGTQWRKLLDNKPSEGSFTFEWGSRGPSGGATPNDVLIRMPNGDVVHPASGNQYSTHNPMNPIYSAMDIPDINLRGAPTAEIGDVVARSAVPEFKAMAFDLIRSTRGYVDGSSGKMGVTSQDVAKAMQGEHFDFLMKWDDLRTRAFADPSYVGAGMTLAEKRRVFNERVMRAVEADDFTGLMPVEQEAARIRKERYGAMADEQVSPGTRWGVQAQPLMDARSVKANYQPVVYNEVKVGALRESLGDEVLRDAVSRSFYGSYLKDAEVRARVDAFLATPDGKGRDALTYARDVAFGIVNGSEGMTVGRLNLMMEQRSVNTGSVPDFRKMRSPFGYDHDVPLPGGGHFSVNDLRSWDADVLDNSYFNRVKGDVSISVGTGRTPEQFQDWLDGARASAAADANLKGEVLAFEKITGSLYGIGIRHGGERWAAVQGILQDLAFIKSSAYMGLLNYGEIAGGIVKSGLSFALKGVPGLGKVVQDLTMGKTTAETVRLGQNLTWGPGLDRIILPTYRDSIDQTTRKLWADSGDNAVNNLLGTVKGATGALAERFWTSRVLNATNGQIIEAARGEFFADLAAAAHGTRKSSFANPARFKEASLTPEQFDGALQLLRETTKIDAEGNLQFTNPDLLGSDPRVAALRRYGQHWSERVIQQNTIASQFRWSHLPLVGILTQFMSFVTRSVNAKLIRGTSDIVRNGNLDEAMSLYVVAPVLSGLVYAGTTYLQSQKYAKKDDRQKFLRERLGEEDDRGALVAGAIKRMPVMSGPSWAYDTIGSSAPAQKLAPEVFKFAGFGKTSVDAKLRREQQQQAGAVGGLLGDAVEQSPAIKMADSLAALAGTPVRSALAGDEYEAQQRAHKATLRAFQGLLPNDPVSQRAFQEFLQRD